MSDVTHTNTYEYKALALDRFTVCQQVVTVMYGMLQNSTERVLAVTAEHSEI
jgi:hypothetical protein